MVLECHKSLNISAILKDAETATEGRGNGRAFFELRIVVDCVKQPRIGWHGTPKRLTSLPHVNPYCSNTQPMPNSMNTTDLSMGDRRLKWTNDNPESMVVPAACARGIDQPTPATGRKEENHALRELPGEKRPKFTDEQRCRLALKAKELGRKALRATSCVGSGLAGY